MNDITVYECKYGRARVYIKETQQVTSYTKYLMEQKLGRKLCDNEQVHHKDENPLNNDLDNLEVKLLGEHQRKHSTKYYDKVMICPWCKNEFVWTAKQQRTFNSNQSRKDRSINSINVPFCSKKCVGQYGTYIQNTK